MMAASCELRSLSRDALGTPPWDAPLSLPDHALPARSDIAIVGAGITGLSAALGLADRKAAVIVIDRRFGDGATVRSGGIVVGDTLTGPAPGFDRCEYALADWIKRGEIDCDFRWTGCLELARDPKLSERPIDWRNRGRVRVAAEVAGGLLDPAKLLQGLCVSAERAGVRIIDGVTVRRIERSRRGTSLITTRGRLTAQKVLMAVDAASWRDTADPWLERSITVVLQTTALDEERVAAVGLPGQPFYTRNLPLLWGRPMRDGSFLFGRELLPFPWGPSREELRDLVAAAGDHLIAQVRRLHAQLRDITVRRTWAGPIARTDAGVPALVQDRDIPDVWWAGGFGGHGLAQAFRLGSMAAECLLGGRPDTRQGHMIGRSLRLSRRFAMIWPGHPSRLPVNAILSPKNSSSRHERRGCVNAGGTDGTIAVLGDFRCGCHRR